MNRKAKPKDPEYYKALADCPADDWDTRLKVAMLNWVNYPSFLAATPAGQLWNCEKDTETHPDRCNSVQHVSQTIGLSDPAYLKVFEGSGLDRLPNLDHVTFSISTRIIAKTSSPTENAPSKELLSYQILVYSKAFDSSSNPIEVNIRRDSDYLFGNTLVFGADVRWSSHPPDILPILKDIFGDWKCVVEFLKQVLPLDVGMIRKHPLLHMNILGNAMNFRRAIWRVGHRDIIFGPLGVVSNLSLQELCNGNWEDVVDDDDGDDVEN